MNRQVLWFGFTVPNGTIHEYQQYITTFRVIMKRLKFLLAGFIIVCGTSFINGSLPRDRLVLACFSLIQLTGVALIILGILRLFTQKK